MRFETAIEHLVDNYKYAKSKVWIRDEVAWALYHTWNEADRKTEPQTIRCPKCGRSDYIREFGKDFSVTAEEAGFKYKCINCNTYIEPQSDRKTENSSEIPNNCKHITEDGVTCAKYPACDDCLDNPLNKVKGSERLLKGKDEPTSSKMEQVDDDAYFLELMGAVERGEISDAGANQAWYEHINHKDEPQTDGNDYRL